MLLDYPEGFVEINDRDAATLSLRDGQKIRLVAPGGEAITFVRVTSEVRHGAVFVPFFLQDVMKSIGQGSSVGTSIQVRIEKGV